ncbi:unnamed protein product [Rotaria sordida]|uniref:Cilia- and flagella-associated protein 97 n=2 Tax=Rotaria sordida TaxID=392033 RepID=A0A813VAP0_9BILA|nr:unnamed protein product [Rotaria sordida]CAF0839784.1 unnamed protein product [Rotaria sordida]CAF0840012.1 unnamed protein product [Rotaria sordida]CAF3472491.1 unnamed protein product [Rotaria sordida]CAF3563650.1 unnamed protein product [Rotaria sordida]
MHKSYQPTRPAANRLLQKKWDDKYYSEHRLLVRDARPTVDTRPPRTYMHLHMKLKKLQLEEERSATIERDNRILLEKMSNIMRTTGSIDNRNDYEAKSLNHEKRRRELLRVSRENSTMIKRIMDRKPDLSRESWTSSWSKNVSYLDNISKYDSDWHESKPGSRQIHSRQQSSKRSIDGPRENQKNIKALVMPNVTDITKADNNDSQQ